MLNLIKNFFNNVKSTKENKFIPQHRLIKSYEYDYIWIIQEQTIRGNWIKVDSIAASSREEAIEKFKEYKHPIIIGEEELI